MGQDYIARKQAKKQRKRVTRDTETGRKSKKRRKDDGLEIAADDDGLQLSAEAQKRKRKKGNNVSLRISRSLCYKEPQLTAEDLAWDGTVEGGEDTERVKVSAMMGGLQQSGYDSDVEEQLNKLPAAQQQQLLQSKKQKQPTQQSKQKPRLSTGVNLLNPIDAAKEVVQRSNAQQQRKQQQQQLEEIVAAQPALQSLHNSVSPQIARYMAKLGHYEPTPIQSAIWPAAVAGKDVQGVAEPGSGKTLAYMLPVLAALTNQHISGGNSAAAAVDQNGVGDDSSSNGSVQPRVLILAPSRELAQQVFANCKALFSVTAASTSCVFGGVPKEEQIQKLLQQQPVVLVATPGRLLDLVDSSVVDLQHVQAVVLDEADKMLSVGFELQLQRLKKILLVSRGPAAEQQGSKLQQQHSKKQKRHKQQKQQQRDVSAASKSSARPQVLLFTATFPAAVQATAEAWLQADAVKVTCRAGADSISRTITQVVHVCAEPKKPAKLLKHLNAIKEASAGLRNPPRVLVFANKIKTVMFVHKSVTEAGYRAVMLHGKRSQAERTAAVRDFKSGKAQVLVASDVASRGLDIQGLPYVVNYDFPSNLETYIHRVGRTGRLAAQGHAYSFFTRPLAKLAGPIVELLQQHDQAIDPNLMQLAEAWKQVEAALQAQGKALPQVPADEEAEDEGEEVAAAPAAAGGSSAVIAEDLEEGLSAAQKLQQAKQQQQQTVPMISKKKRKQQPGDMLMVPSQSASAAADGGGAVTAEAAVGVPDFIPSKTFVGAKVGMVFTRGSRGQGYYRDQHAAADASTQRQQQIQRLALQQVQKQQKAAARKQQSQSKQQQVKQKKCSAEELPPLPGIARQKKKQQQFLEHSLADDDGGAVLDVDDSTSDDEQSGGSFAARLQGSAKGKKKSLPGRLRKKLAKQKAKQASS